MNPRILLTLAFAILLTSCSSRDQAAAPQAAEPPAAQATSAVTIKGSDTMVILAQRLAERFMNEHPGKTVQVTGGGSGTGVAALINGTTLIANASRAMKPSETAQVQQRQGKPAIEHSVALDGLAIYVHESNPLKEVSLEQLAGIYEGKIHSWEEIGGTGGRIVLYGRENNSGTYAYFKEQVLRDEDFAAETQTLPGTAAVVNAVSKDPKAIGYGGIAFSTGTRTVPVKKDATSPAIEPTMENVTNGSYPISRYLFMYTAGEPTGDVKAYIDFALSDEGQKIASEVGYYPLPKAGSDVAGEKAGATAQ